MTWAFFFSETSLRSRFFELGGGKETQRSGCAYIQMFMAEPA